MGKAFITLAADRIEPGALRWVGDVVQQETRLFMGADCVCVLLVSFPPGSPEWCKAQAMRTLDGMGRAPGPAEVAA